MATKKNEATATAPGTALATEEKRTGLALVDPLAGIMQAGDELGVTGTEELGPSEVRIPALVFNTKFTPEGARDPIPPTRFLNSMTEQVSERVRLQVVYDHKSRSWSSFDESAGKRVVHCRSWDGVMGRVGDAVPGFNSGDERPCAKCPDYQWKRIDGKNVRHCGDVHNLVAIDRDSGEVVMMPLRKTAIGPWREYYQRNFYMKRPVAGMRRVDLPLFAAETVAELRMERDGSMSWAVPEFKLASLLSRDEILFGAETCRAFIETKVAQLEQAAERAEEHVAEGGADSSFDFGANAKAEAGGAAQAGARF